MSRSRIHLWLRLVLDAPDVHWILLGFSISYMLFFIAPVFLSSAGMRFFEYIPPGQAPIGADLKQILASASHWAIDHQLPYVGTTLYPPLAMVLFTPFIFLRFSTAYRILTLINVICYAMLTLAVPLRLGAEKRVSPLLLLIFVTGAVSYGFQFELNRGQFNVVAVMLALAAVWIFHKHSRYRFAAYVLFVISVQLKLYPFIFALVLVDDWREWRSNARRLAILAGVNFALLFALGPGAFFEFLNRIRAWNENLRATIYNHSIRGFVAWAASPGSGSGLDRLSQYAGILQAGLIALVCSCILLIILRAYRRQHSGFDPQLLLACTVAALLIPPVSNDYTLSILAGSVSVYCVTTGPREDSAGPWHRAIRIGALLLLAVAYSSMLFSYTNKPLQIANSFPALLAMLLALLVLSWLDPPERAAPEGNAARPSPESQSSRLASQIASPAQDRDSRVG